MAVTKADFLKLVEIQYLGLLYPRFFDYVQYEDEADSSSGLLTYETTADFNPNVRQGITRDALNWYSSDTDALYRFNLSGVQQAVNASPFVSLSNSATANHVGDIAYYDNKLYVPICNWTGSVALDQVIAVYDSTTLAYITDYDVSSETLNNSGFCISNDGLLIYAIGYSSTGTDKIEVYNRSDGTHNTTIELSRLILNAQGIEIDSDGIFNITSDDRTTYSAGYVVTVQVQFGRGFVFDDYKIVGSGHSGEMEGCCIYDGEFYAISYQGPILKYTLPVDTIHIDNDITQRMVSPVPDEATILLRFSPKFFNYNSVFDSQGENANEWESWVYGDGRIAWRIQNTSALTATLPVESQEYIIAFTWLRASSTVTLQLGVDGVYEAPAVQSWVTAPSALYLSGSNLGNPDTDNIFRGYAVFNRVLTATELTELNTDFDSMYSLDWAPDYLKPTGPYTYNSSDPLADAIEVYIMPEAGLTDNTPTLDAAGTQRAIFWNDIIPYFKEAGAEGYVWQFTAIEGLAISPADGSGASNYDSRTQTFFCRIRLLSRDEDGRNLFYDYRTSATTAVSPVFHAENSEITNGVRYSNDNSAVDSPDNIITLDQWVTLGVSCDNGLVRIFADGTQIASDTIGPLTNGNAADWVPFFTRYVFSTDVDRNHCDVAWMAFHPSRACTQAEGETITADPYQLLIPVGGSGVTGSGSPQADTATSTGSGLRLITGSGSPQADTATSSGTGTSGATHTGSGSPQADTATSSGTGLRLVTGSGSPQADTATSTGTGTAGSSHIGSGSPQADTATSTGSGLRLITGSGSAQADTATSSGTGLRLITGSGSPQADTATSTGIGTSGNTHLGSGSPQADTATSSGTGLRLITGSGSPQADTATSTGEGSVSGEITGSGSPQADTATSSGTGLRIITGSGSPQADTATCIGYDIPITISSCRVYDMQTEDRIYNKEVCQ